MINPVTQLRELLLNDQELLEQAVEFIQLTDRQILFHKGDPGDAFYLIQSGKLRIFTLDHNRQEITLNTMVNDEMLGELAILDLQPRSASAIAVGDCRLIRVNRSIFLKRMDASPALSTCIIQLLSSRVRHMTEYIEHFSHWSSLIIDGAYQTVIQEINQVVNTEEHRAETAAANTIGQMVKAIQRREETLRQEVAHLKIEIDQKSRQSQVKEITNSESFQDLLKITKNRRQSSH